MEMFSIAEFHKQINHIIACSFTRPGLYSANEASMSQPPSTELCFYAAMFSFHLLIIDSSTMG